MASSTQLYRLLMAELERKRIELGLPMWRVDDLAGTQDRYYSKAIYCDSPSGRRAGWEILDDLVMALFGRQFTIRVDGEVIMPSEVRIAPRVDARYLQQRHWRHLKFYQDMGSKGGKAFAEKHAKDLSKIGRRIARVRWKKYRDMKRALAKTNASTKRGPATSA